MALGCEIKYEWPYTCIYSIGTERVPLDKYVGLVLILSFSTFVLYIVSLALIFVCKDLYLCYSSSELTKLTSYVDLRLQLKVNEGWSFLFP
jgi:hypothetical protein